MTGLCKRYLWLLWIKLAIGCAAPVEPDQPQVTDTRTDPNGNAWPDGLPTAELALSLWPADLVTERCVEEASTVGVLVTSMDVVNHACTNRAVAEVAGCFKAHTELRGFEGIEPHEPHPWVIVSEDSGYPLGFAIAHELAHWLYACSGLGASYDNHDELLFLDTIESMRVALESGVDPEPIAVLNPPTGYPLPALRHALAAWPDHNDSCTEEVPVSIMPMSEVAVFSVVILIAPSRPRRTPAGRPRPRAA